MIENPLELGGGFGGLTCGEVRQSANIDGIQTAETSDEADAPAPDDAPEVPEEVWLVPHQGELTPQQAADVIGVSRQSLTRAMDAGRVPLRPAQPLAHLLFGAMCEGAMKIARSEDPPAMQRAVSAELRRVLRALAVDT